MEPSTHTAICVRFDSQDHYRELVNDKLAFRAHLLAAHQAHPELFPSGFASFHFHSMRHRCRVDLPIRRVRLPQTRQVFAIRPSFLMPGAIGTTDEFAHPLNLKRWAVPNEVLSATFGRDPKVYERAMRALCLQRRKSDPPNAEKVIHPQTPVPVRPSMTSTSRRVPGGKDAEDGSDSRYST